MALSEKKDLSASRRLEAPTARARRTCPGDARARSVMCVWEKMGGREGVVEWWRFGL